MKEADNIMLKILGSQKRCGINIAKRGEKYRVEE
jgi:hypothetical protein